MSIPQKFRNLINWSIIILLVAGICLHWNYQVWYKIDILIVVLLLIESLFFND